MSDKTCKNCVDIVSGIFAEDFKDGICMPCQCYKEEQEDEQRANVELARYNSKHGAAYTINGFYHACDENEVSRDSLKRLPMLRDIFDFMVMVREEQAYIERIENQPRQLSIFESNEDLPF
jgi:hypothetical protein